MPASSALRRGRATTARASMRPVPTPGALPRSPTSDLVVHVMNGPIGAASAMKMSYAGITKGLTALGAMMILAAAPRRRGRGTARGARAQPAGAAALAATAIPAMYSKAYRFVGEMEEISDYVGEDASAQEMFDAFADFYTRLAADFEGQQDGGRRADRIPQAEAIAARCGRRSGSSAPVRPGCFCHCCCSAPASIASCWNRIAATMSKAASAPACWSRAPSI